MATIRRQARSDQLGVVALHEHGSRGDDDLVVMALGDFVEWFVGEVADYHFTRKGKKP